MHGPSVLNRKRVSTRSERSNLLLKMHELELGDASGGPPFFFFLFSFPFGSSRDSLEWRRPTECLGSDKGTAPHWVPVKMKIARSALFRIRSREDCGS